MRELINSILLLLFTSCTEQSKYELKYGLWQELHEAVDSLTQTNPYVIDNQIYVPNREFIYDYFQIKHGDTLKFSAGGYEYIKYDSIDNSTLNYVSYKALEESGFEIFKMDYRQTVVEINFYNEVNETPFGKVYTGVIENKKNLWIHPPRKDNFKILELNPFPLVQFPLKVGNRYNWELKIGDYWSDPNWKVWSGVITNKISYHVKQQKIIETSFGPMKTFIIEAEALSKLGKTMLTTYFNEDLGIIKMKYTNIDSSIIKLDLIKITSNIE